MTENIIEIIPFSLEYESEIKTLNIEWLENFFEVEESDKKMLSSPQEYIIDKGGKIFYAKYKNQIVGTVTLLKIDNFLYFGLHNLNKQAYICHKHHHNFHF